MCASIGTRCLPSVWSYDDENDDLRLQWLCRALKTCIASIFFLTGLLALPNDLRLGIVGTDTPHVTSYTRSK